MIYLTIFCYVWFSFFNYQTFPLAMKITISTFLIIASLSFSYTEKDENNYPTPEVSFEVDGKLYESTSSLNVYSIDNSPYGYYELAIHVHLENNSLHLNCTTTDLEGIYDGDNSIEGERGNIISYYNDEDGSMCKNSTSRCDYKNFTFTIVRQSDNKDLLSGTFEGVTCNEDGGETIISNGSFKNFRLFPEE